MCLSSKQLVSMPLAGRKILIESANEHAEEADRFSHQEMLLREMQHRIANSLQIVAGIVSLKARTATSDDVRVYLLDAYARVMSVAAVQRQLLISRQSARSG